MADELPVEHTLTVRCRRLRIDPPLMVADGMRSDTLAIDLDGEWDGLGVVVTLGDAQMLWSGAPLAVPAACLAEPGWLAASVTGYGGDGTVRVTTEARDRSVRVVPSGMTCPKDPPEDAPDLLGQLVEAATNANEAATNANEAAQGAADAAGRVDSAIADLGERSLYAYADPDADDRIILEYPAFLSVDDGTAVALTLGGKDYDG